MWQDSDRNCVGHVQVHAEASSEIHIPKVGGANACLFEEDLDACTDCGFCLQKKRNVDLADFKGTCTICFCKTESMFALVIEAKFSRDFFPFYGIQSARRS